MLSNINLLTQIQNNCCITNLRGNTNLLFNKNVVNPVLHDYIQFTILNKSVNPFTNSVLNDATIVNKNMIFSNGIIKSYTHTNMMLYIHIVFGSASLNKFNIRCNLYYNDKLQTTLAESFEVVDRICSGTFTTMKPMSVLTPFNSIVLEWNVNGLVEIRYMNVLIIPK